MRLFFDTELDAYERNWQQWLDRFYAGDLSPADVAAFQEQKLRAVLAHVQRAPFYRERLRAIEPDRFRLAQLATLSFTTKDDLRSAGQDILSLPAKLPGLFYETSGTTGAATPCPRNAYDLVLITNSIRAGLHQLLGRGDAGAPRAVAIMGPSDLHSTGDSLGNAFIALGYAVFKVWPFSPAVGIERALRVLREHQIEVLMATPGTLQWVHSCCARAGLDVRRDIAVDTILITGEYCSAALVENYQRTWGATVYNFHYGSQEVGHAGVCCKAKHLHMLGLNHIYEIIDPVTGTAVPEGQVGELVLTLLQERGSKPLIRYRTGDLVIATTSHACPLLRTPILEFCGRVKDLVVIHGNTYSPRDLETLIVTPLRGCVGYRLHIGARDGKDRVTIDLEFATPPHPAELEQLSQTWQAATGVSCRLKIRETLDPVTRLGAYVSWKGSRIHDRRNRDTEAQLANWLAAGIRTL